MVMGGNNMRLLKVLQNFQKKQNKEDNLIKNRESTQFTALSEKEREREIELKNEREELSRMIEEQEKNNIELETMLNDYDEVAFHMHLFSGEDDIILTKIDNIIDNACYDIDLIGISDESTFELHAIGGSLSLFPIAYLCSFFNNEVPQAFDLLVSNNTNAVFGGYAPIIVCAVFSLLFALRPYFLHKLVFTSTHEFYFSLKAFAHLFVLVFSIIFVDIQALVPSTQGAGLMITAFAYGVFYYGINSQIKSMESISNMEALKTMLPQDLTEDQMERLEMKMMEIQMVLGDDTLHRVMLDTALSRNPNGLLYTANPVVSSRVLFDKDYYIRVSDWGGGYPRPFVEILEGTWRAKDNEPGLDLDDPELDRLLEERDKKLKRKEEDTEKVQHLANEKVREAEAFLKRKQFLEEHAKKIFEVQDTATVINDNHSVAGSDAFLPPKYNKDKRNSNSSYGGGRNQLQSQNGSHHGNGNGRMDTYGGSYANKLADPFIPQPVKLTDDNLRLHMNYSDNNKSEDGEVFDFSRLKKKHQ